METAQDLAQETLPIGEGWAFLDAPDGAYLDLARRTVELERPAGPWLGALAGSFEHGVEAGVDLVALSNAWPAGPARLIGLASADGGSGARYLKGVEEGDEWLWTSGDAWGYVRLVELRDGGASFELAAATRARDVLARDPAVLVVDAEPEAFELAWDSGSGGPWLVERRPIGAPSAAFAAVAEVAEPRYRDAEVWDAPGRALFEWRVSRAADPRAFGVVARAARVVHPGSWPLPIRALDRIDLVTGEKGGAAHVEVTQCVPPVAVLMPLDGTLLQPLERGAWRLPSRASFDPSSAGKLRPLNFDGELAALTREGIVVRVSLRSDGAGGAVMLRETALEREPMLPRPPELVAVAWRAEGIALEFAPAPAAAGDGDDLALVVEAELGEPAHASEPDASQRSGDWVEVVEEAPGARTALVRFDRLAELGLAGELPLVRLRVRQRFAFGPMSFATPARVTLLVDPSDAAVREELLARASRELDHAEWRRRVAASDLLEAFGDDALPALTKILEEGSSEARNAARRILSETLTRTGRGLEVLYSIEARRLDLAGEPPRGLFDPSPAARAHALLRALDDAERNGDTRGVVEVLGWAEIAARHDSDLGLRAFADLLTALPPSASPPPPAAPGGGRGALAALLPRSLRASAARQTARSAGRADASLPWSARELARELEDDPSLADADVGPVLGALLHVLRRGPRASEQMDGIVREGARPDYDLDTADLALRLIARFERTRDARLLDAARGLCGDWGATLAGWRQATMRRANDAASAAYERASIRLAEPRLGELEGVLAELRQSGATYVDVVLPAGEYVNDPPELGHYVDLDVDGLRLVAEGDVVLRAGLRVMGAEDVVLDGIAVENAVGAAILVLERSHLVVRSGRVLGFGMGIQAQDSDLELLSTHVGDIASDRPGQWSVRHLGTGRLVARATLFTGGSVYVGDLAEPFFDRCVVDAGERPVLQAQREGRPIVRESFLRSTAMGLVNVTGGCLAGVVMDVPRDPLGPRPMGLRVDGRWFAVVGAEHDVPAENRLERSPLEPD